MTAPAGTVEDLKHKLSGFSVLWCSLLWTTMARTGKGYRKTSLKRTGKGKDRRPDKLKRPMRKCFRAYEQRYS